MRLYGLGKVEASAGSSAHNSNAGGYPGKDDLIKEILAAFKTERADDYDDLTPTCAKNSTRFAAGSPSSAKLIEEGRDAIADIKRGDVGAHFGNVETGEETPIEEGDRENDTSGNGWRLRVASYVFGSGEFSPLDYARIMWTLDAGRLQEIAAEHSEWHAARQAARDWLFVAIREKERADAQAGNDDGNEEDAPEPAGVLKTFRQFKSEYVAAQYLLDGLIQAARLYTLTGRTGHGKTLLLILIALALATGRKGLLDIEAERSRVVYASYENPEDFRTKLIAAAEAFGIADNELDGWLFIVDANCRRKGSRNRSTKRKPVR